MIIIKLIAVAALGFGIFWVAGKLRDVSVGWFGAMLEAINPMVRLVVFYAVCLIALANIYFATAASLYFLAFGIGGTIPVVMCAIEDFREYFGR